MKKKFEDVVSELKGKPILIANRGIPARRICRAISEVFDGVAILTATDVDKTSPSTTGADELILLGENPTAYLDLDLVIKKAKARGVVAIHPGWGFGAEDETFPAKCEAAGILFIGPPPEPMRLLGNKVAVRKQAKQVGVPIVPGSEGAVTIPEARELAKEMGYPIMLKAEGGGGGRGIYEVYTEDQLESAFEKASAFAQASFGNPRLFIEKLLTSVRHIEIQVIADRHGNVFAFDERDCTVQRNHQKLIEVTPSPWEGLTDALRENLKTYAEDLIRSVNYYSLATVEFLVDQDSTPYMIEVNTRLQVEHGITECRYGIDLVEEQIAVAFGSELRFNREETRPFQHAIQVRVNCEDPQNNFSPNAGQITRYVSPGGPGVRLDSCITAGYEFPSQYDSAAALLITYGNSWHKTVKLMQRALSEYLIGGVKTTIPFHEEVVRHPAFVSGNYDTKFIEKNPEVMAYIYQPPEVLRISRLIAEISAKGYNPYLSLGEYRGPHDKRIGVFDPAKPLLPREKNVYPYPRWDRTATLDFIRTTTHEEKRIHYTDTTTRDQTQSNSGNRFRLAEDRLIGPYIDRCNFFSLENGGGAHFHVAMLANMTYPFTEAKAWNAFAPDTLKQILIRSTNVLGYKPQPKNLMRLTGEMICENYDVIRCFDFLNHVENMEPFAEVVMNSTRNIFEPAISLSYADGFTVERYMQVTAEILAMVARVSGCSDSEASRRIILGLKDMAGVCPPRYIRKLVAELRKTYPDLVLHYHRHYTDGLFVPAVGAAVDAGTHIVDVGLGAAVRWYGQGEVLSTASYIEEDISENREKPFTSFLNKDAIRDCNFLLKQVMPYYDKYTAPYFRGIDHDVVAHGMPGGATSSSQEGAMKQGYIKLLPHMLKFLASTRKLIKYHDVTPGSQITWNTAFLAITGAYKRGGDDAVYRLLEVLGKVTELPESELDDRLKRDRLEIYRDSNDAFRDLLLGKFGKLPLGFPADWVYESAFGKEAAWAIENRTKASPLETLQDVDLDAERDALRMALNREPSEEEFVLYLNHPGDALKTIEFQNTFSDPNLVPLDVWFEGLEKGTTTQFADAAGKPHAMTILDVSEPDDAGLSTVRYLLDSGIYTFQVKTAAPAGAAGGSVEMAEPGNVYHVGCPSNGDLWVMYVKPGDTVKKGQELFNISIMKQEKAVTAKVDGRVKRVLKSANYQVDKKMLPVKDGELLVELEQAGDTCDACARPMGEGFSFCPYCGHKSKN